MIQSWAKFSQGGLSHSSMLEQLGEILASDKFLLNCCGKPERDLEGVRSNLQKAAFDEGLRNELLGKGDFESFIADSQTSLLSNAD